MQVNVDKRKFTTSQSLKIMTEEECDLETIRGKNAIGSATFISYCYVCSRFVCVCARKCPSILPDGVRVCVCARARFYPMVCVSVCVCARENVHRFYPMVCVCARAKMSIDSTRWCAYMCVCVCMLVCAHTFVHQSDSPEWPRWAEKWSPWQHWK